MQQYIHAGIVKIIMNGLSKLSPEFLRKNTEIQDLLSHNLEVFPAEKKAQLLNHLLSTEGADIILRLGECCKDKVPTPLLYVFLNSSSPRTLIDKLERYYQYLHSTKRIQFAVQGDNSLSVRHISLSNQPISPAEDFFACGMVRTLLELIGCQQVSYAWEKLGSDEIRHYLEHPSAKNAQLATYSQWRFMWERFHHFRQMPGLDDFIIQSSQLLGSQGSPSITETVESIIRPDLSNRRRITDIAKNLCMTPRTLQRRLQQEGNSFTKIVNKLRIETTEKLLIETDSSLIEIGFIAGFSDYSHFSREFQKAKGFSPLSYRKNSGSF